MVPPRAPRQASSALGVEAPPPPWDDGGEPPRHGVDAHVAYVSSSKHRPIGGQGHGLDQVEVLPSPNHVPLIEEGWWGMIIGGQRSSVG
jgi:hypothetical protein